MTRKTDQAFESIRIVGGLLGSKVLQDARRYQLPGQDKEAYGIEPGLTFNEEIGRYWRIAQGRWQEYQQNIEREDISSHKLAQNEWLLPLLSRVLGYRVESSRPKAIGERVFPLTHTTCEGAVPLVLCGADHELDKGHALFGQEGRKRSPMGLVQEYLNAEDACLWALVSNGRYLRLLRDNPAMTRPAYIEIDFDRLFEEDNYADFATLWLFLHASRLLPNDDRVDLCWLEQWRDKGHDEGERALDKLRYGVADALRQLGTGFVAHQDNTALREKLSSGELSVEAYFQQVLRLVYRFLFMFTAEDRDVLLLPAHHEGIDYADARELYSNGYSLGLLRERARLNRHYDSHGDAWQQLLITFQGLADGQPLLAQSALGGLFAKDQCADIEACELENRNLFNALFDLSYFEHNHTLSRINYRDMDTEEFGSVYESLLELTPQLNTDGRWHFSFMGDTEDEASASGHSRKLTGSYYTPDSLVQELIKSALEPVIADRLAENIQQPREAILGITVCDPACGSGHFLLAAARRLASELAHIDAGTDQPTEQHYRHAIRDVVRHCIYGVDLNPMAVELCKTGLWLESIEPGKPLSFLDAHVQCGNALVGILDSQLLEEGIPAEAFKALTGDDKQSCTELRRQNTTALRRTSAGDNLAISLRQIPQQLNAIEAMPEETVDQVEAKRHAFSEAVDQSDYHAYRLKEDLFTAAFFAPKTADGKDKVPTTAHLIMLAQGQSLSDVMKKNIGDLATQYQFFHWPLAFPHVFSAQGKGGFDVILGNPPWERIKLQEQEYFASRAPEIAAAKNAASRSRLIDALATSDSASDRTLYSQFKIRKKGAEGTSAFSRLSGRFPLTGRGDVNLYALFAEHFAKTLNEKGRAGVIVPTGISTDDSTKIFFGWLAEENRLASLFDFENRDALFKGVHRSYKFCLLTMGSDIAEAELAFFASQHYHLTDKRRRFSLSSEDFALINPNTLTCPVFRSKRDAELTKKIYRAAPVLIREETNDRAEQNPWNIKFARLFDMANDSSLFRGYEQFEEASQRMLPLYEAKMVHHYDHRWATYETDGETSRDCTLSEKQDPEFCSLPRYWVPENEITVRTAKAPKNLLDAMKKHLKGESAVPEVLGRITRSWLAGHYLDVRGSNESVEGLLGCGSQSGEGDLFNSGLTDEKGAALQLHQRYPLSSDEVVNLQQVLERDEDVVKALWPVLEKRRPSYLLGWRDICRATDERTVISGVIPLAAVGDTFLLMYPEVDNKKLVACLLADQSSLPHDFIARQKVGGTHLKYNVKKQIVNLAPSAYTDKDIDFIVPRVVELVYTARDLESFARDLEYQGRPYVFDKDRRHQIRSELDAYYAKLYGLNRDELRYILDPSDVMGEDYPSETFRVLKNKEVREFGEYRTQRLVLDAWDSLESGRL
jgi:Eco57I restriction-modification methylase